MTPLDLVVLGLSLSSSWGNGHASTYRSLLRGWAELGHRALFLERDTPWYRAHRDLPDPDYCDLALYDGLADLERWAPRVRGADAVMVGSYVPQGVAVGRWALAEARGVTAFYDIDTPVTLAKLKARDFEYLAPGQIGEYQLYLSFTGGPTLGELERVHGSPMARVLYCSADTGAYRPRAAAKRWDLSYLGAYSPDRQAKLERLLLAPARRAPWLSFVVAGAQYPDALDWPANVERIEHVPPADHARFYAQSRFTLNITRRDMAVAGFSPSVRLFEAAACAAPIISDDWPGLDELFTPGSEILIGRDTGAVLAMLDAMGERQRRSIGAAARRRVLGEHCGAQRARELELHIRHAAGRRRAPAPLQAGARELREVEQ